MSPKVSPGELCVLQQVLRDAGYLIRTTPDDTEADVAGALLIRLFTEGVTDPVELSRQLEHRFGKHPKAERGLEAFAPSSAIRGLSAPEHAGRRSPNRGMRKALEP